MSHDKNSVVMTSISRNHPFSTPFVESSVEEDNEDSSRATNPRRSKAKLDQISVEELIEEPEDIHVGDAASETTTTTTTNGTKEEDTKRNFDEVTERLWGKKETRKPRPPEPRNSIRFKSPDYSSQNGKSFAKQK